LTVSAADDLTATLSDNGAGGSFSTTDVTLDVNNNYVTTVAYTPARPGTVMITATPNAGDSESVEITVSEYSLAIGFVGDSLSAGYNGSTKTPSVTVDELGVDFSDVNKAVSGKTTGDWVTDAPAAAAQFQAAGVETAMIMLGTNDAKSSLLVPVETYKANLTSIINSLKSGGVKKVILNQITFIDLGNAAPMTSLWNADSLAKIQEYNQALYELVDGETVMLGDVQAYEYFANNTALINDGVHMTNQGFQDLGEFWAEAYARVILDPADLSRAWTGSTADEYAKETAAGLEYTIDKDAAWFAPGVGNFAGVLVDGAIVEPANYSVASGSTVVTLSPAYLNGLALGGHTLTVRFSDGVSFSDSFSIQAAAASAPGNPTNPTAPIVPVVPGVPNTGFVRR
jgi:lysophospholipase L1-like esterase